MNRLSYVREPDDRMQISIGPSRQRDGVVLVVVLAALLLFSVLVAGYVVFSNQAASITPIDPIPAIPRVDLNELLDEAGSAIIRGSDDHHAATYEHSLLEDLYGNDGWFLRVGHDRAGSGMPITPTGIDSRGLLLRPIVGADPQLALFKFPTAVASWYSEGIPPSEPYDQPLDLPRVYTTTRPLVPGTQPYSALDDWASGRLVTFLEGPLANESFRIIRSYGHSNNANLAEEYLAGNLVIDLTEVSHPEIAVNGSTANVFVTATTSPNELLYSRGDDEGPGVSGVDDDSDGTIDEIDELGYPGSDDVGYAIMINGNPFNGKGSNPLGQDGISRLSTASVIDPFGEIELQFNSRLTGDTTVAGGATPVLPQNDEEWDAADFANLFLAHQPSDHRQASHAVYTGAGAAELNDQLGSHIIPSFHRPAVINYLMNAPIVLPGETRGSVTRTFWDLDGSDMPADMNRLQVLLTRLRRATIRPLNMNHAYAGPGFNDLDGDGIDFDGAPGFTGSNPTPILAETLDTTLAFNTLRSRVAELATWLVNGPWDVDNDGDGIPDSVWADFASLPITMPDGSLVKPLFAALIEDMDGRVNVNYAGNLMQLHGNGFEATNPFATTTEPDYFAAIRSKSVFGRGGGVGPAELNFMHLFDEGRGFPVAPALGPLFVTQTSTPLTNPYLSRYGNLLNTRYGGTPSSYTTPATPFADIHLPGNGTLNQTVGVLAGQDLFSRINFPSRRVDYTLASPTGAPQDWHGRVSMRKDRAGNPIISEPAFGFGAQINDVLNQPYEFASQPDEFGGDDDEPFEPNDLIGTLRRNGGSRLAELLDDELERNVALRSLITSESQHLDVPEVAGHYTMVDFFLSRTTIVSGPNGTIQDHLDRMLAPEFRKGALLNLNRQLANGQDDAPINTWVDDTAETNPNQDLDVIRRQAAEQAFPQLAALFPQRAHYTPLTTRTSATPAVDFDGVDTDNDGLLDQGATFGAFGRQRVASGNELLARHLYCLMYLLCHDQSRPGGEFFPEFPYPGNMSVAPVGFRNRYAARRIAQWAVNAVDIRDTDAICTRLRYDWDLLGGFDLSVAAGNVVWGMEAPEAEITETFAAHDKRLRRELVTTPTAAGPDPDNQHPSDEDNTDPDTDMDQFRIPQASSFVELRAVRSQDGTAGTNQSLPAELYDAAGRLDLGRVVGTGVRRSPVWRLAVGERPTTPAQSVRFMFDAERVTRKLILDDGRAGELSYLGINPTNALAQFNAWNDGFGHAAGVVPSLSGPQVFLGDDDLDFSNGSPAAVNLRRFVWFANLQPDASLTVLSNPQSGMTLGNVFFNGPSEVDPLEPDLPENAPPLLLPGQYALVAPRPVTRFGQNSTVNAAPFEYDPSPQAIGLVEQNLKPAIVGLFRANYWGLDPAQTELTPLYREDASAPLTDQGYAVNGVVPIIARSLYPHQIPGGKASWAGYFTGTAGNPNERVKLGFNISAPLAGADYYDPPTHRISTGGIAGGYPMIDGYRDYDAVPEVGLHPDQPFDHPSPNPVALPPTPMQQYGWTGIGTYQEAASIFLQRLADPTQPWHPTDNPYLTMDVAPMDLTVFNGEGDPVEVIPAGVRAGQFADQSETVFSAGNFTPALRFDTRRKIPDVARDRAMTALVPNSVGPTALSDFDRQVLTERPGVSSAFSVLSNAGPVGGTARFPYALGAMWTDTHARAETIDSSYGANTPYSGTGPNPDFWGNSRFDDDGYRQTLGFVNREFGVPAGFDPAGGNDRGYVSFYGRGMPIGTTFTMLRWLDREFSSPLELIDVPATSWTGMKREFSPGTQLQDQGQRELPSQYAHLLGFYDDFAQRGAAADDRADLSRSIPNADVVTDDNPDPKVAGQRTPFELIFDYVSTGSPSYKDQRWFPADQVVFSPGTTDLDTMYNRTVEFLQPPYNYTPTLRIPGRINLNTTPDYVRLGGPTPPVLGDSDFLDANEDPAGGTPGGIGIQSVTQVSSQKDLSPAFTGSALFGNGSVYRSFAWAGSSFYDLDDPNVAIPTTLGEPDGYASTVDSRFGRGFKAFIESRRGYPAIRLSSRTVGNLQNPELDYRFPTRFGGMFATAGAAKNPSVQRFMRTPKDFDPADPGDGLGVRRRTHDMTVLRPHPDFDPRTISDADSTAFANPVNPAYALRVEAIATGGTIQPPVITGTPSAAITNLRMTRLGSGLFDRSLPERHKDFINLGRVSNHRHENAARYRNVTTHHSNVYRVRMTVGLFVVDPVTGSVGEEYRDPTGAVLRGSSTTLIDRSVPVGFRRGEDLNTDRTVLFKGFDQ